MSVVLCRVAMWLQLPVDVWDCVSQFLHSDSLGRVCQRLRGCLGIRYVKGHSESAKKTRKLLFFVKNTTTSLRTARLCLHHNALGDSGAQELVALRLAEVVAALNEARSLHTLSLDVNYNEVGYRGAQALAALKDAPVLHTLILRLESNKIGDRGAQALAGLKEAPSIRTLSLHLDNNKVGDRGAQALAALKGAPSLLTLVLRLENNRVGERGAKALAALKVCLSNAPSGSVEVCRDMDAWFVAVFCDSLLF